ncbi:hypothetical protein BN159_1247 [Streptomyces davaonensis JCM 4913]|uniref:Uncharacterized protein n=1 Tax=Streptomyces davaonensis (strain DSM 101723 / JCM 4913 / KCC S-0913 / 768) TaxID=1214101 RepID=K4QT18_STRDJ|nr:hypothetical protein [Streptomyces davaonensis]CCK25626.1 hypothetical protein BN159_1247 [Streptomyces davaonensis JCM 4913]
MAGFNQQQFDRDRADLTSSLRRYNLHKDERFMRNLNAYLDQLQVEGSWIAAGHTPNANWVGQQQVNDLIGQFDRKHAFHVPADWWRQHRNDSGFRDARAAKAAEAAGHGYLWSKTEPGPAAKRAAAAKGLILETSVPGKLFDGKNFGFERWSDSPTMGKLWENFSTHYVDGLDGPVKAVVLDGIVDNSVLTRLEWPRLLERIEAGDVPPLRVNVMNIVGDRNDSRTWTLQTVAGFDVGSQQAFDNLPRAGGVDFWTMQGRWHDRQRAEAGNSSDSASSGSSGEYTLENFHQVFDQPNTIVVLSDPTADSPPRLTASPEQLSRVVTNQLSRTASGEALAGRPGQSTPESARSQSGADLLALATLDYKLDQLKTDQDRRGSDSSSPERSASAEQSPYAMPPSSGYDMARSSAYDMPQSSAYDMSQLATDLPGTAPTTSQGGYFPAHISVSSVRQALADQASAGNYPASPVSGTQSYNPGQSHAQRTPSTGSSDYSGGAPLERVERRPSDPPAESSRQGADPERREHREHRGRQHKEPPAWLKWASAGGARKKR